MIGMHLWPVWNSYSESVRTRLPWRNLTNQNVIWEQRTGSFSWRKVTVCLTWKHEHYRPVWVMYTIEIHSLTLYHHNYEFSLKTHLATTKKAYKLTNQIAKFPERFETPHFVGFFILSRPILRIFHCYWFKWEKDRYPLFSSIVLIG